MLARCPGEAIQALTIDCGVASHIVPHAMFSPTTYPSCELAR